MNKFFKCMSATALAAVMSISALSITGANLNKQALENNVIVADAISSIPWYPESLDEVPVKRYNNYASLPSGSTIQRAIQARFCDGLLKGQYKNYRICYTNTLSSVYGSIVFMYDPVKHPELNSSSADAKIRSWLYSYLQYTSALKQVSGVSVPVLSLVLDSYDFASASFTVNSNCDGRVINLNAGDSNFIAGAMMANTQRFNWTVLHEAGHAFKDLQTTAFISSDEVYCNLRALCALRALKCAGVTCPNVELNGETVSAMQYAFYCMKQDYNWLKNNSQPFGADYDYPFERLGMIFENGLGVAPRNYDYKKNANFINNTIQGSSYNTQWNKLYALCISKPLSVWAPFMTNAVNQYKTYDSKRTAAINGHKVTLKTALAISSYRNKFAQCTASAAHAYSAMEFLCGNSNLSMFLESNIPGTNISYASFANKYIR